jgi:DNA-binding NtrC family response regulator
VRELEHAIERSVVLAEGEEIDNDLLGIDLELVNVSRLRSSSTSSGSSNKTSIRAIAQDPPEDLSLEDYFQRFVLEHQDTMSETELAQKLGVSRKCLWERRQRFGIPRAKASSDKRVSSQKD